MFLDNGHIYRNETFTFSEVLPVDRDLLEAHGGPSMKFLEAERCNEDVKHVNNKYTTSFTYSINNSNELLTLFSRFFSRTVLTMDESQSWNGLSNKQTRFIIAKYANVSSQLYYAHIYIYI